MSFVNGKNNNNEKVFDMIYVKDIHQVHNVQGIRATFCLCKKEFSPPEEILSSCNTMSEDVVETKYGIIGWLFAREDYSVKTDYTTNNCNIWIEEITIVKSYQRQGLGTALLKYALSHFDLSRKWKTVRLDARVEHDFYVKLGFVKCENDKSTPLCMKLCNNDNS